MIAHIVRMTLNAGASEDAKEAAFASLRNQGEVIPSVRSYVVGPDVGGDFEWGAMYVLDDLDGYWEYLKAPAHRHTDEIGLPLVDRFVSFDITDSTDPTIHQKIAELHRRRYAEDPGLTALVQALPSYDGSANPQD
ncbi:Dabb family protein [Amnibacterium kyonggiense]|uniref:Stress responsive alpha/beta barrel protein n=1 Tax=Amnibacterium kyonggiense TaxID=595671 RepID=A0A4R7FRF1_9MICO|nr:Dabb family protein [Amnibacterium kyonggiense]TDS80316.1 stress responsive alpha/beta barrel protein [Amnibacterium kyonggiense]